MKMIRIATAIILGSIQTSYAADPPNDVSSVPEFVNYQGRLVTPDGDPYSNTTHDVRLELYDTAGGGTSIWGEKYSIKTQDGYFSVLLGSGGTPIEESSSNDLWRVLWKDGDSTDEFFMGVTMLTNADGSPLATPEEASPRQQFLTSPFAFRAHQSVYASKARDEFEAESGIKTSNITSESDLIVTTSMRISGDGNTLHANEITADEGGELEIIGQPDKAVEVTSDGGILRIGLATQAGSPAILSDTVRIGQVTGSEGTVTLIHGKDIHISGPDVTLGNSAADVDIRSGKLEINSHPMFQFEKVSMTKNGDQSMGGTCTIDHNLYFLTVINFQALREPPSNISVNSNGEIGAIFFSEVFGGLFGGGTATVLGIQKGLIAGFEY